MICYGDRSYCASQVAEHTCGRELTKEDEAHAKKIGLPIAWGNFCDDKPEEV